MAKAIMASILAFVFLVVLAGVLAIVGNNAQPPIFEMDISSPQKLSEPLRIRWKIQNRANGPICIYSTFLRENAVIKIDPKEKIIEIRFTGLETYNFHPYYFPATTLAQVDKGESIEGEFTTTLAARDIQDDSEAPSTDSGKEEELEVLGSRIVPGTWKVRSLLGFGKGDFETISKKLKDMQDGSGLHPINSIVRWQTVVYSNSISVSFVD